MRAAARLALWRRAVLGGFAFALTLAAPAARADTPIALFRSFAGNVNFVGTQKTMRTQGNGSNPCAVTAAGTSLSATLSGIPGSATVLNAQLYWAGSGSTPDYAIVFNGGAVSAPTARQFFSNTIGSGYDYFGGAVDVTAQVAAKRNGTYTFSGLTINNGAPYCAVEGVLGGFALLVVYSDGSQPYRVLNIYEGFQFIRNNGITLTLSNFRTPNPLGSATGRVGHITWEGDATLGANGEDLFFNGTSQYDAISPQYNQFNSASSINGDTASYGIDFDAYTVGAPTLTAGQTSASTVYSSGQDLVLLNAEIIAVPNVPAADLALSMTRNGILVQGQSVDYTLTVSNGGPSAEAGPVVISETLPSGVSFAGATGSGWSCSVAGDVVTCSNASALAVGKSLPKLVLTLQLNSASGALTTTASVAGQQFDNNQGNNSASDTGPITARSAYVFTDAACVHGLAFGAAGQTCAQLGGNAVVAGAATPVFVTAVSASGVPTQLSGTADTSAAMRFALSCINPVAAAPAPNGVQASLYAAPLPLCTGSGATPALTTAAWSASVSLLFKSRQPSASAGASFAYGDVGKVQLWLRDSSDQLVGSAPFVVKPFLLALSKVERAADNFANPAPASGAGPAFAKVGAALAIHAQARTASGAVAPNFGNEGARLMLVGDRGGDGPAQAAMQNVPKITSGGAAPLFAAPVAGVCSGTFAVDEAGIVAMTPKLVDVDHETDYYLGASVASATVNVGRFIPDHFDTIVASTLDCLPHMNCPPNVGAAYSAQPFAVTVNAMSPGNVALANYTGVLARDIVLSAWDQAGGAGANPAGGALGANLIAAASVMPRSTIARPAYILPGGFASSAPRARNWTAPTVIAVRADGELTGTTAAVSSKRAGASVEGGLTVISGRLSLDNPHGSELQRMPVRAEAQYWASTGRWETSASDNLSGLQSGGISFANCLKALGSPCKAALLGVTANSLLTLQGGRTLFWLRAPGAGNQGSVEFQMNNPAWLPSTIGRAVFGISASPYLYLREMY